MERHSAFAPDAEMLRVCDESLSLAARHAASADVHVFRNPGALRTFLAHLESGEQAAGDGLAGE